MTRLNPSSFYDGNHYDVSASVGQSLVHLMMLMRREVELRMATHGLTDAQWKPMWLLKTGRATTAFELAREMGVDAGAVTRMVDRLEAKGLIERMRSESDRRVVHLRLTEAGETAVVQVPHVLASINNDFLLGFSVDEWQQLRQALSRMTENGLALQAARADA